MSLGHWGGVCGLGGALRSLPGPELGSALKGIETVALTSDLVPRQAVGVLGAWDQREQPCPSQHPRDTQPILPVSPPPSPSLSAGRGIQVDRDVFLF